MTRTKKSRQAERLPVRRLVTLWARTGGPVTKSVLLALDSHAGDDGVCWPSIDTVCRETEWSRRSVQKALRDLETAGLVASAPAAEGGRQRSSVYTIDYAAVAATVPAEVLGASPALVAAFGRRGDEATSEDAEGRTACAPAAGDAGAHQMRPSGAEGRTTCAPTNAGGAQQVRGGGAPHAPPGAHLVRPEQSRGTDQRTHTPDAAGEEVQPAFGVPGLWPDVRAEIALGSSMADETPTDHGEASRQAHQAMKRHPSTAKIPTANQIAARMLLAGEITAPLLEAAVEQYERSTRSQTRHTHRHNWLTRGEWRDDLAAVAAGWGEKRARQAAAEAAERRRRAEAEAEAEADRVADMRDQRVRRAMAAMDARELAPLAQRRLDELEAEAAAGSATARVNLQLLRRQTVSPDSLAWRVALADLVLDQPEGAPA